MGNNNGLSAFPRPYSYAEDVDEVHFAQNGMTLRDYFAAKALPEVMAAYDRNSADDDYTVWDEKNKRLIAITAYDFADAMLEARK